MQSPSLFDVPSLDILSKMNHTQGMNLPFWLQEEREEDLGRSQNLHTLVLFHLVLHFQWQISVTSSGEKYKGNFFLKISIILCY